MNGVAESGEWDDVKEKKKKESGGRVAGRVRKKRARSARLDCRGSAEQSRCLPVLLFARSFFKKEIAIRGKVKGSMQPMRLLEASFLLSLHAGGE